MQRRALRKVGSVRERVRLTVRTDRTSIEENRMGLLVESLEERQDSKVPSERSCNLWNTFALEVVPPASDHWNKRSKLYTDRGGNNKGKGVREMV